MKKNIFLLSLSAIFLLTGCSKNTICTLTTKEDDYKATQKITIYPDGENNVEIEKTEYIMEFEKKGLASQYYDAMESLKDGHDIKKDNNKIIITYETDYSEYETKIEDIKKELNEKGYLCK